MMSKLVSSFKTSPGPASSYQRRRPRSRAEEALGKVCGSDCQPPVEQCFPEVFRCHLVQLDQIGVVAVEVRDGEEAALARREYRFLFRLVGGADRQDRALGRPLAAEPLEVGLAERALPGEGLARDLPV